MCLLLSACVFLFPFIVRGEYIEDFKVRIEVQKDASFDVTEEITYVFDEPRHGIMRDIPLIHPETASAPYRERYMDIELLEILQDGKDALYVEESTKDTFVVRIGDPHATLEDVHTYTVSYSVTGGLSYPESAGTELYWNATGNAWRVPIRSVQVELLDPTDLFGSAQSCYAGTLGETSVSCAKKIQEDGTVVFRATGLNSEEGITIAQSLNEQKVPRVIHERFRMIVLIVPLIFILFSYGVWRLYRYETVYKTNATIIPQYEPYHTMKPMYTGFMMDGRLDPQDITACIVYLAQHGYLKITKTERKAFFLFEIDDYEITLLSLPDSFLGAFEEKVFGLIFKEPFTVGAVVTLSDLKKDMGERRANYTEFTELEKSMREDLRSRGFREVMGWGNMARTIGTVLIIWAVLYTVLAGEINGGLFITGLFILVVLGIFLYERKTRAAYEVTDYLKGFKLFLETTERDRYLFHNAPEKNPEQFMEYLPYAIAFGVEEKWAEVFKDIALPTPDWYSSGSGTTFNATSLAHSFGAFSTAFAQSSGASASSGGGSTGGGAGGGGGGSW